MEVEPIVNYDSLRSKKARFTKQFGKAWMFVVYLLIPLPVLLGVDLLIQDDSVGWLVSSLAAPLIMLAVWCKEI